MQLARTPATSAWQGPAPSRLLRLPKCLPKWRRLGQDRASGNSDLLRFFSEAKGLTAEQEAELWSKFKQLLNGLAGFIPDTISEVWWRNLVADPVFTSSNGPNSAWRSTNDGPIKL